VGSHYEDEEVALPPDYDDEPDYYTSEEARSPVEREMDETQMEPEPERNRTLSPRHCHADEDDEARGEPLERLSRLVTAAIRTGRGGFAGFLRSEGVLSVNDLARAERTSLDHMVTQLRDAAVRREPGRRANLTRFVVWEDRQGEWVCRNYIPRAKGKGKRKWGERW